MCPMKVNGMDLEYVPEKFRTPEVCLQAVMSNRHAKDFVPEWTNKEYNIYNFTQSLKMSISLRSIYPLSRYKRCFKGKPFI